VVALPYHHFDIASHPLHVYLVLFDVFGDALGVPIVTYEENPNILGVFLMLPNGFYISLVLLNVSLAFP
jgi:hypothetical protein